MANVNTFVTEEELSPIAFSGDYNDLKNIPSINDATEAFGPEDFQKAMLQYFDVVGEKDPTMKTYSTKIRNSVLNMEEFGKLGSGMFIHWGVYSVPAGHYDGVKQPGSTVTATDISYNVEWSMRDLAIPKDVYKAYEQQFTGENFDADALCKMVSELGMKYIIITSKHHEGFCLAPTEHTTGWDIRTAACRNTVLDELKAACEKYKLKFCMYYSQYWDWMNEGGFGLNYGNKWTTSDLYTADQHTVYCKKAIAQIQELVEKYKPYTLWYDPGTSYASYIEIFRTAEKENYPNVITNDRLDYTRKYGDFGTGERTIYLRTLPYGESCFTLNNTWGYSVNNETSSSYYSLETILKQFMLYTISYGQNCVLNVGPKPDGSLSDLTINSLTNLKTFITNYAHGSFYGYTRMNTVSRPKWGYMIAQPNNKLMCYIITKSNRDYSDVILDGIDTTMIDTINILTPGTNPSYTILDDYRVQINGLALDSNSKIGVVEIVYQSSPICIDATTTKNHEFITSRVFPVNGASTYNFSKCCHEYKQANSTSMSTELIWLDSDCEGAIKLDYTLAGTSNNFTPQIIVTDLMDETLTATFEYGACGITSNTKFNFKNGHRYKIKFSSTGSDSEIITFNGFTIEHNDVEPVIGVTVSPEGAVVSPAGTTQLTASVIPSYADDTSVSWASDNEAVATVSQGGLVTGVSLGTCNITVTTTDGGYMATCQITVSNVGVSSVEIAETAIEMYQGQSKTLYYTVLPTNAANKNVAITSSNNALVSIDGDVITVQEDATGTATITITTEDSNHTATCDITIIEETYDYIFEAESLDGSETSGEDTGLTIFDSAHPNWTLFGFAQNSVNAGQVDNNATLYQCVVNSSPWTGLRVDADNNTYPRTSSEASPLIPRFLAGNDRYINPINGEAHSSKPNVNPNGAMHPVCFSRDGNTYKYSIDGVNWKDFGYTPDATQLARLTSCPLTVGFDYNRSGGVMLTTKRRKLITNDPCCVAIHYETEYPFYKLYNKYDASRNLGEVVENG